MSNGERNGGGCTEKGAICSTVARIIRDNSFFQPFTASSAR